jgi:hypothetical protein
MKLSDVGLKEGLVAETIVTTYNEDGSPNAAPMGIRASGEDELLLRIHTTSDTYKNLIRNKGCVINISFDPYLFITTTILGEGKGSRECEIDPKQVEEAKKVKAPFLKECQAYIEAELLEHHEYILIDEYKESEVSNVKCKAKDIHIVGGPVAVNRGLFAAIELAIALSRKKHADIEEYLTIMEKTLPPEDYKRIIAFLKSRI